MRRTLSRNIFALMVRYSWLALLRIILGMSSASCGAFPALIIDNKPENHCEGVSILLLCNEGSVTP
jgi:hypothetical protein